MVWLVNESRTQRQFGQRAGHQAPNAGRKYPAEPLTPAEVAAIIGQCSLRAPTGIRNRALLTLLYRSGLRVSEILAVRPSDVDMARHSIRLLGTKSGQAQTRGFHPSADDALARWLDTRQALGTGPGKLFCTLVGTPLSDDYVRGLLHRLGAKAGISKRVHPHGLRHFPSSQPVSTPGATCATSRSPPATPTHAPQCVTPERARKNLDRHPNYILAAYMASGT
jgi:site-specific recombinase XerD